MQITTIEPFLDYFTRVRERTARVVLCIPHDQLEWSWGPSSFTLGDLVRHIATIERYMFAETVHGKPSRYPGHGRELADGWDAVQALFQTLHLESMVIFSSLSDEDLQRKCITPNGSSITVWKWLRSMVEHEIHHRAQIYTYLAMLGVMTPPLYGLTSEQVHALSNRET